METKKLKDFVKRGTHWHEQHKQDLLYMVLPLIIISWILVCSLIVAIMKMAENKLID